MSIIRLMGFLLDVATELAEDLELSPSTGSTAPPPPPPRPKQKKLKFSDLPAEQVQQRRVLSRSLATALMAVAMADDRLTSDETIRAGEVVAQRMGLYPEERRALKEVFKELAQHPRSLEAALSEVREHLSDDERRELVEGLYQVARADDEVHRTERAMVKRISDLLGVDEPSRRAALGRALGSVALCYDVLGVAPDATDAQLKEAYLRRTLSGVDEAPADPKAQKEQRKQIEAAYEELRRLRGIQ